MQFEDYYPPTAEKLGRARGDLNGLIATSNINGIYSLLDILYNAAESSRIVWGTAGQDKYSAIIDHALSELDHLDPCVVASITELPPPHMTL